MTDEQRTILLDNAWEVAQRIDNMRSTCEERDGFFNESPLTYRIISAHVFSDILKTDEVEFTDEEMFEIYRQLMLRIAN